MGGYGQGGYGQGGYGGGVYGSTSNSTTTLQSVVDYARTFPDLTPVLSVGGYSSQPALTIANDVMTQMLSPSMNWKWNRFNVTPFYTISWQQDYAVVDSFGGTLQTLAWVEHCWISDINNTAQPKPIWTLEAVRDLERTFRQYGRPGKICWLPNDQLLYGTWGASPNNTGQTNPGANVVYTLPLGQTTTPVNPITQIQDTNGNLLVLTTYGTCGGTQPTWPARGAAPGVTVTDGTCVWTVINPKGQGFRIDPLPPQNGVVYQVNVVAQKRPPQFSQLSQTLEPIPDDFSAYFRQGFVTFCYDHSPDPRVRQKFPVEYKLWIAKLQEASGKADRERDNAGFYPGQSIMDVQMWMPIGPANPYGWGSG